MGGIGLERRQKYAQRLPPILFPRYNRLYSKDLRLDHCNLSRCPESLSVPSRSHIYENML